MAEWAHYSLPNAEWTAALAAIGGGLPPLFKNTDIKTRREMVNELTRKRVEEADKETCEHIYRSFCIRVADGVCEVNGIKVEEKRIPVFKPEGEIPIRIYTPDSQSPEETFPALVDLHGAFRFCICINIVSKYSLFCRWRILSWKSRHRRSEMPVSLQETPHRSRKCRL